MWTFQRKIPKLAEWKLSEYTKLHYTIQIKVLKCYKRLTRYFKLYWLLKNKHTTLYIPPVLDCQNKISLIFKVAYQTVLLSVSFSKKCIAGQTICMLALIFKIRVHAQEQSLVSSSTVTVIWNSFFFFFKFQFHSPWKHWYVQGVYRTLWRVHSQSKN